MVGAQRRRECCAPRGHRLVPCAFSDVPELPEVETVRRGVSRLYLGRKLLQLSVSGPRTVRRHDPGLLGVLRGRTLCSVGRHGKYLLFGWDDGQVLVAHLRMSGQLLAAKASEPLPLHTHAVLRFSGAGELRFVDPRTFGEFFLAGTGSALNSAGGARPPHGADVASMVAEARTLDLPAELAGLGPDALDVRPAYLGAALAGRRAPLKALLVDQRVLAGVGNIYADEICFAARLRPDRPAGGLRPAELHRLAAATHSVLANAIAAGGSTLSDQRYRGVLGEAGSYQFEHKVYGRAGQPCLSCGRPIERATIGAKSAYLCRRCQR